MFWVFLLGFTSGYPWVITASCLSAWLADADVNKGTIGLFGLVATGYAINFFWGPVVDHVRIPLLHKIGLRRSWLFLCVLVMCLSTFCLSIWGVKVGVTTEANLSNTLWLMAIFLVIVGYTSATLDIVTAAYRINIVKSSEPHLIGIAASMEVAGWWTGYSLPAMFALLWVDKIGWNNTYLGLALLFIPIGLWILIGFREPEVIPRKPIRRFWDLLDVTHFGAVWEFLTRLKWIALFVLLFIFTFKLGEAFLGRMSIVFYKDVGFTNEQVGWYSKGWNGIVTVTASIFAGLFIGKFRAIPTLIIGGIAMAATNLMFAWIAVDASTQGVPSLDLYFWTVLLDGISGAFATIAFVTFITHYTSRVHSATQYAAMASLGTLGRTTLAASSGFVVIWLGDNWSLYFILTAVAVIPALSLLFPIARLKKRYEAKRRATNESVSVDNV